MKAQVFCGDVLDIAPKVGTVDLVMCSPPYEAARTYGIDFNLKGQEWVDWAVERYMACLSVCRGLVVWVVEGQTRDFRWSAAPALMLADLHRRGVHLRKPPVYYRNGIPGSGGPDFLRNDWEWCICGTNGGKLPWSDNTAMGKPPEWHAGGVSNNRAANGKRKPAPKYAKPDLANPGNVIKCVVGGGNMGSDLTHDNEAPFPEKLVEMFVRSFCPPDGIVWDCFSGSGTTAAVSVKSGRNIIASDIRQSQCDLTRLRVREAVGELRADEVLV